MVIRVLALALFMVVVAGHTDLRAGGTEPRAGLAITTEEGARYEQVRVTQRTADSVTFYHAAGVCTLPVKALDDASRAALVGVQAPTTPPAPNAQPSAQVCPDCKGFRTVTCPGCVGTGFGPDKMVNEACSNCGGDGYVTKFNKLGDGKGGSLAKNKTIGYYGDRVCPICKGQRTVKVAKRDYCPTCGGKKVVPCGTCAVR